MEVDYIIVQAGGKGTRMERLTKNKPKALVPVKNLPILFHLFQKYPDKKYVIIGDYKYEVLKRYLEAFAQVDYQLVNAGGSHGTCAGIQQALSFLPPEVPFLLIWSDLILPPDFQMPKGQADYVGIAKDFLCRWNYENGRFCEEESRESGVAGLFLFQNQSMLADIPKNGEFVRWLKEKDMQFQELPLYQMKEYGLISEYEKLQTEKCRPFNRLTIQGDKIRKEGIDQQGKILAAREQAWYEKLSKRKFPNLPKIYSFDPLLMEKIDGKNIYEYTKLSAEEKKEILKQVIGCLKSVQEMGSIAPDRDSYYEAYIGKTFERLNKIRDLVPFAGDRTVMVNGKRCRNIFFEKKHLEEKVWEYFPKEFRLIHGDGTFSNILLKQGQIPVLIDPRGYFGTTRFFGDPAYDWAKLYYSIVGNYDQFNQKRFTLDIQEEGVWLQVASNHWEDMEQEFFRQMQGEATPEQMRLLHAIIWLSLTTYAWEDYDSICGAFYNGLFYLEEAL